MRVIFFLKGAVQLNWKIPDPSQFNFQLMCKMIRADGQFLAEGVYIQANEIAAILLDHSSADDDLFDNNKPNVSVHHKNKLQRHDA